MSKLRDKRWATIAEVHTVSEIPVSTLRSWCQFGKIPCSRRGGKKTWYIDIYQMLSDADSDQKDLALEVILGRGERI